MNDQGKGKTRREFIKQSIITAGVLPWLHTFGQSSRSSRYPFDKDALNNFKKKFSGQIILPGDTEYEAKRKARVFTPKTDKHPSIIATCKTEQDVLRCIEFARRHQLEIAVRSGNHSNMGWGTSEKGFVIDLSQMKGIVLNVEKKSAVVSTGATAREILAATAPYGLAPVLGQCGSVGAGILLGGGLGWLSGKYGATCDNLLAARVITADTQILNTDSTTNQDLFWAIRGGGGNFGIVTSYNYQLQPVSKMLEGSFYYPISDARMILRFFNEFMTTAPDELQADCYLTKDQCWVQFLYFGDLGEGEQILNNFRKFHKPVEDTVKRRPFSEVYGDDGPSTPNSFRSTKGSYLERLTNDVIDLILNRLAQSPDSCDVICGFSHYMHGEVCRILPDATAFELRKSGAAHLMSSVTWQDYKETSNCIAWHNETFEHMQAYSGDRIYSNYMSTEGGVYAKAVYGNNFLRLTHLKKKYDPDNIFHLNQNILPG